MKLGFDEVLDRLNDERRVERGEVQARALTRKVWVAEWHLPGCLSEYYTISKSKKGALEDALFFAEDPETGPPRGMKTALKSHGYFQHKTHLYGWVITTVVQHYLRDII